MTKVNLFFWILLLLLLSVAPVLDNLAEGTVEIAALAAILVLGVPHGAIDNVLFLERSRVTTLQFYVWYLGAIALNVVAWFVFPLLSFFFFLVISAYHFGQAQLSASFPNKTFFSSVLFTSWGTTVLAAFIYFNSTELITLMGAEADTQVFTTLVSPSSSLYLLLISTSLTLGLLVTSVLRGALRWEMLIGELWILGCIFLAAELFSFLVGFGLFFVAIHAFKVMETEFNHFYTSLSWRSVWRFIRKLAPLSLLSFFGITSLILLVHFSWINLSYRLLMLITISSITLPHAFVMERFYHFMKR